MTDLVTQIGIDIASFGSDTLITAEQHASFQESVQTIVNDVRVGVADVKSRTSSTIVSTYPRKDARFSACILSRVHI